MATAQGIVVYECVDGHKALAICRYAAVETQPCQVADDDGRKALVWFAFDHFPLSEDDEDNRATYNDDEVRESFPVMVNHWTENTLTEINPVAYNLDQLEMIE